DGTVALVTVASRGMGESTAVAYAAAGADVVLAARSSEALSATADRIQAIGRGALAVTCDVREVDDVESCVDQAVARFGTLDVLVNNAGGPLFNAPFLEIREDGWDKVLTLNLASVVRFCRRVGAHMVERGAGSIVNVGS